MIVRDYPYRAPCKLGLYWMSYGRTADGQTLLEPCLCGTHEACSLCGEEHVWIARCQACGSRSRRGLS